MAFSIEFTGVDQWIAEVQRTAQKANESAIRVTGEKAFNAIKMATPVKSGKTRKMWRIQQSRGQVIISNNAPNIRLLEFGGYGKGPGTGKSRSLRGVPMKDFASTKARSGVLRKTFVNIDRGLNTKSGIFAKEMDATLQFMWDAI